MLPDTFIIKANNGDGKGTNKIIRKADLTPEKKAEYIEMIGAWLSRKNIGALHAEPHYKNMRPCVIAEEVLPLEKGATSLTDYKMWCFNGKCYYTWICNDRSAGGNSARVMTYDMDWNPHPEFSVFNSDYLRGDIIPKPKNFDKWWRLLRNCQRVSQSFVLIYITLMENILWRIDLYFTGGIYGFLYAGI